MHCKYLNARFECNDIVISVYSHYPFHQNAKSSDTKCFTLSIKCSETAQKLLKLFEYVLANDGLLDSQCSGYFDPQLLFQTIKKSETS